MTQLELLAGLEESLPIVPAHGFQVWAARLQASCRFLSEQDRWQEFRRSSAEPG